jgi:Domain of unknown function (DUF397)
VQERLHVHLAEFDGRHSRAGPVEQPSVCTGGHWRPAGDPREAHMHHPYNGIPAGQLGQVAWLKSSYSNPNGNCVEIAWLPDGQFAVRNSRHPEGPALIYTRDEIAALIDGARGGDFDHLVS